MRLSTKGRYAVTAMLELAIRGDSQPVSLGVIADTQGISNSYLEQLFRKLSQHGLVKGMRGPNGGYRLSKPANQITVADIITAVDEKVDSTNCNGMGNCQDGHQCLAHELWTELSQLLFNFLDNITLEQYANRPSVIALNSASGVMPNK